MPSPAQLSASRRQLLLESVGIAISSGGFGLVYGLAARLNARRLLYCAALAALAAPDLNPVEGRSYRRAARM